MKNKFILLITLLSISLVLIINNVLAKEVLLADLIYPPDYGRDIPQNITAKWHLDDFEGEAECQVVFRSARMSGIPTIREIVPCYPGENTHDFNLLGGEAYHFYILVSIDGQSDNIIHNYNEFVTIETDYKFNDDFVLISPTESSIIGYPLFSWKVPDSQYSTINMSVCAHKYPTSPIPVRKGIICNTGEICEYDGNNFKNYFNNNDTFYWHIVIGDVCWRNIELSGKFTVQEEDTTSDPQPQPGPSPDPQPQPETAIAQEIIEEIEIKNQVMYKNLKGKIMLQVESAGEAYYIHPNKQKMYFLGRPEDAFLVMREQGVGISNNDLSKIPVALDYLSGKDSSGDGLPDDFKVALGLDVYSTDSDGDGYCDFTELIHGYDPLGPGRLNHDLNFAKSQGGRILLQVEQNGEAWYVSPEDNKRYFLGRPADAFSVMRNLGLGISNNDFNSLK